MILPTVVVLYDAGAAGPAEIVSAARGLCEPVLLCDPSNPSIAPILPSLSRRCRLLEVDMTSAPARSKAARSVAPAAVTTFSELCMEATSQTARAVGLEFHNERTTVLLTDKLAQRASLRAAGVDDVRCASIDSRCDIERAVSKVGFPSVLKPRRGFGSVGVSYMRTADDLAKGYEQSSAWGPMILEEYLDGDADVLGAQWGDYVSVESYVLDGYVQTLFVTGKLPLVQPFRERGIVVPAALPVELVPTLEQLSTAAVRACGVRHGITHVEIKLTGQGPRILEVHGRLGGYVAPLARRALAIDLVRCGLEVSLGLAPEVKRSASPKVAMEYFLLGGPDDTDLLRIDGDARATRIPGVLALDIRARPGAVLDWRTGSRSQWGSVHVDVDTHGDVSPTVCAIERTVRATFARQAATEVSQ